MNCLASSTLNDRVFQTSFFAFVSVNAFVCKEVASYFLENCAAGIVRGEAARWCDRILLLQVADKVCPWICGASLLIAVGIVGMTADQWRNGTLPSEKIEDVGSHRRKIKVV